MSERFYVWHGQGEYEVAETIEEARELRDEYLDEGDYSAITNDQNEMLS